MSSGSQVFQRAPRYTGARRAAIVAASAVVLSGGAMVLSASTFAGTTEAGPLATVAVAGAEITVPDVGVPLPAAQVDTEELGLPVVVETAPEPEASTAEEPAPTGQPERTARQLGPHSAVSTSQPTRLRTTTTATAARVAETPVSGPDAEAAALPEEQRAVIRAAATLASEKGAPNPRSGLGLVAPFAGTAPDRASGSQDSVATLDLAVGKGAPSSAAGDWDLMPEVGFAAVPLALAAMVLIANGRRSARLAGEPQRRRHASS